jgi:hypothetical protein
VTFVSGVLYSFIQPHLKVNGHFEVEVLLFKVVNLVCEQVLRGDDDKFVFVFSLGSISEWYACFFEVRIGN